MRFNILPTITSYLLLLFISTREVKTQERNAYFKATDELLLDLRHQMITRSIKFDEHFRSLLSNSKISLHQMFQDAYGQIYEQNTEIFTNMFESLEQYYAKGEIKLSDTMENFFKRLYQKIFQVFHQNKVFTPDYLGCATDQLVNLKTFKDISDKLINGIRHSFVAARTFEQALNAGVDFIRGVISLGQPQVCTNLINEKLVKNSISQLGQNYRLPCLQFCEQVITRCIGKANLEPLDLKWKSYVLSLADLAKKLGNNYNIETIIAPLDVQISEAIMNFQENAANISNQVFQYCGKPPAELQLAPLKPLTNRLGKRATPLNAARQYLSPPSNPTPTILNQNHGSPATGPIMRKPSTQFNDQYRGYHQYSQQQGSNLAAHLKLASREGASHGASSSSIYHEDLTPISQKSPILIDEIKNYMLSTKNFWSLFPTAVCTSNHTLGSNVSNSMRKQFSNNCFTEQLSMSDINSDLRYRLEFNKLVGDLDSMRSKIEQALTGEEIDWTGHSRATIQSISNEKNPNNIIIRPPYPSIATVVTTSTTTTSSPDVFPENPDIETTDDYDIDDESGSGSTEPSEEEDPESSTTEDSEYIDSTEMPTTSTDIPDLEPEFGKDMSVAVDNNIDTSLITTPDAQKSSQSSNKLVIGTETIILLASLIFIAIFIVTCRSVKIRISKQRATVKT